MIVKLTNSVDHDQTAPMEQSDHALHCLHKVFNQKYRY